MVPRQMGHRVGGIPGEYGPVPGGRGGRTPVVYDSERTAAGAGVIENDFHDRPDLRPNLCALYVEPLYRGRGLAHSLLDAIRADMGELGEERLYLVTDHTDFYEKCGWEFLTLVNDLEGRSERMYAAKTL